MQENHDLSAEEVKAFRATLKLSQVAFATALQVGRTTVEKWEKQGAPGRWRHVFAAIGGGVIPWSEHTEYERKWEFPPEIHDIEADNSRIVSLSSELPNIRVENNEDKPRDFVGAIARLFAIDPDKLLDRYTDGLMKFNHNDRHLVLTTPWDTLSPDNPWGNIPNPPMTLNGIRCDHVAISEAIALKTEAGVQHRIPRLSGNGLLVHKVTKSLILYRRQAAVDYPAYLHVVGGGFDPLNDKNVGATIVREAHEKIDWDLQLRMDKTPYLLMIEEPGFWHMAVALGAEITDQSFATFRSRRQQASRNNSKEGRPVVVHIDDIVECLKTNAFVPSGRQALIAWIALGAPCNGERMLTDEKVDNYLDAIKSLPIPPSTVRAGYSLAKPLKP